MSIHVTLGSAVLLFLLVLGFLETWRLAYHNGTFNLINELLVFQDSYFPSTKIHIQHRGNRSKLNNDIRGAIFVFFYPIFNAKPPKLTLLGLHFYGQLIATWMLMMVEASRLGNAWKIISFITLWGLAMENVAMALVVPAWSLLHLLTSTTLKPQSPSSRRQSTFLVHPIELQMMPWAVLIGLGFPIVMIFLTDARTTSPVYLSQQLLILLRMVHPLFTALLQMLLSVATRRQPNYSKPKERNEAVMAGMRTVYDTASTVAIALHVGTLSLSISTILAPSMFTSTYRAMLNPWEVFAPDAFWMGGAKVKNIAGGAMVFLRWDELASSWSILSRQTPRSE